VPGLQFNGVATSIQTVTFQVVPQRVGTFTIPAPTQGGKPLTLNVRPGNGRNGSAGNNSGALQNLPAPNLRGSPTGPTQVTQDGSAFVRLLMPRRELFVGETVPVKI